METWKEGKGKPLAVNVWLIEESIWTGVDGIGLVNCGGVAPFSLAI